MNMFTFQDMLKIHMFSFVFLEKCIFLSCVIKVQYLLLFSLPQFAKSVSILRCFAVCLLRIKEVIALKLHLIH